MQTDIQTEGKSQEIKEMIKAGFSCFYVYTEDEEYVQSQLVKIAEELSLTVAYWTVNDSDLGDCLSASGLDDTLSIFTNVHFFLEQPGIIQAVKDNLPLWKSIGRKVFFIENDIKIPPEINRNLTFIEFELPDKNTLIQKLEYIQESAKDAGLDIELDDLTASHISEAALGLTLQQAEDAFSLSIVRKRGFDTSVITDIKAGEYLKSGIMELEAPQSMDSFQGYDNLQEYILDIKDTFTTQSRFNLSPPKGILLVGVPGTGKTLASKVIASVFNLMLLKVDIGKVFSEYVGASERGMRQLISASERMAPIVLRIDEIEKQLGGMGGNSNSDSGVGSRVLAPFLSWLQDRTKPVFIVATANNIESLRPELLRKGRFDEIFFLDLPTSDERRSIFDYHLTVRFPEVNWTSFLRITKHINSASNYILKNTKGWSGAEIEQVVIQSLRQYERLYTIDHLVMGDSLIKILTEEVDKTVPLSVIRKEDIDKIRNWAIDNNARLASENEEIAEQQSKRRKLTL